MVDITRQLNLPSSMSVKLQAEYVLYLPAHIRVFDNLEVNAPYRTYNYGSFWMDTATLYVPLDLITAARLKLIKPYDDSGIGEEQWAWMKLIGLTGEN